MASNDIDEVRNILVRIHQILEKEEEKNWIRGIEGLINTLDETKDIENTRASYKNMTRGAGSFSDYYIHRDDFDERVAANKELDELTEKLWRKLFP
jgi:hypothetical protein